MQRAVVLGATGHIGQAVVRELLARGLAVTAATRQQAPSTLQSLPLTIHPGDSGTPGQFDAWIEGHDLVVDCAAPYPLRMYPVSAQPVEAACQRTASLLAAIQCHGARLAYISSFTTLPRAERGIAAMEAQWRRSIHPYFEVKRRIEDMLLGAAQSLDITVVNPTVCMGPWDSKPPELCFIPQLLAGRVWATSSHVINVIDVRDLASLLWAALNSQQRGGPIPLVGHNLSVKELARRLCSLAGVARPPLVAPARLAAWSMVWAESLAAVAGQAPLIHSLSALLLCDCQPMYASPFQDSLGHPVRPIEQTLKDSLDWFATA